MARPRGAAAGQVVDGSGCQEAGEERRAVREIRKSFENRTPRASAPLFSNDSLVSRFPTPYSAKPSTSSSQASSNARSRQAL